jgi:threonine dehydratase
MTEGQEGQQSTTTTLEDVLAARQIIAPHVWRTPLAYSDALSRVARPPGQVPLIQGARRAQVYLKLECWQRTGSFKVRGALAKLASMSPDETARGVVTASAGNHGLGVAYASRVLASRSQGNPPSVTIFVPESASPAKVQRLVAFDCQVRCAGADYDAAHALAEAYARQEGACYLSAYDDPAVIAGQGTVALEVVEDLPGADILIVPVGGGGLIAGTAIVARSVNPTVRIVGVQPEASPSAFLSLRDGRAYEAYEAGPTICDGLAGGFGRLPFEIAGPLIDQVLVVPEADVRQAVGWLLAEEQLLVEGSGAIAVAPLLNGQLDVAGKTVVAILTGRNLDAGLLQNILAEKDA